LGETEDKSKPKEKRIEEKEKLQAEVERSLMAAQMKEAHKKIEDVEKLRKHCSILSICKRIDLALSDFYTHARIYNQNEKVTLDEGLKAHVLNDEQIYKSIRTDFQKVLEIKDEDMQKLFPEIEIKKDIAGNVGLSLGFVDDQLKHMKIYCERMLT
jgi:predicted RND superfamily exporter protein